MKKYSFILMLLLLLSLKAICATGIIDSSYSYDYSQPPEFQPSLNGQFTALSCGVTDVNANPAGIMHIDPFELAIGASGFVRNPIRSDENRIYVEDSGMKGLDRSPNSRAYVRMTDDRTSITPESRPITITEDYSKGGGINYFGTTFRVADWLAFSVSRRRPTAISFNYQALVPVLLDAQANFRGVSFDAGTTGGVMRITNNGSIEVFYGGLSATSEVSAWGGFLQQGTSEVNWMNGTFNNSIVNHNSIILSAAAKTGQVNWGVNIIPMTVDIELNNEVSVTSDNNNNNLTFYIPKIDFNSTAEAINWVTHECTVPTGYRSMEVETFAGKQIGAAKVAGKYSGSLTRMDFGVQWEPTDYFSMGAVYENFNGATLRLEGVNEVFVKHWVDVNSKMPVGTMESYWDPFLPDGTPTHEVETETVIRNTLTMQPIELPRNIKFGFAFKKPILIAVDWEQWQNEYSISSDPGHPETAHYITMSGISFLKLGMESQFLFLPMIMRGSLTGMMRPVSNDKELEKNLDDLYANLPIVPVDGNIYLGFGVLDGEFGLGVGGGGLPLLRAVMLDMSSIAKVFYANTYFKKGDWQISYLMTVDPVLTGFSSDISTSAGSSSDIKLMQTSTLSIGVKF